MGRLLVKWTPRFPPLANETSLGMIQDPSDAGYAGDTAMGIIIRIDLLLDFSRNKRARLFSAVKWQREKSPRDAVRRERIRREKKFERARVRAGASGIAGGGVRRGGVRSRRVEARCP